MLRITAKIVGIALMALALWQWISFGYPDVNPFKFGGVFVPGAISQVLNWLIVCALAASGWGLFVFSRGKAPSSSGEEKRQ